MVKLGVTYLGNRFFNHASSDLKRIARCSDYVIHPVSETDLTFHKAVLHKIFRETKRLGMDVWADPWGLGGVFGGEAISKFLLEHRDSWQIMSDGQIRPHACLNQPAFRSFVKEWVLTVRDMGADVIFWDEPHMAFDVESEWKGVYACVCELCKEKYKSFYKEDMPMKLNTNAKEFRRGTMRAFLDEMMSFSKSKGLRNALCLYAFKGIEEYERVWKEAAELKDLDIFGCDPYWRWRGRHDPYDHVKEFAEKVVASAKPNNKETQIWIQAMRLPKGKESEIIKACEGALAAGVGYIAAWSYDGGEILDTVLSENPEEVWKNVERTYSLIKAQR